MQGTHDTLFDNDAVGHAMDALGLPCRFCGEPLTNTVVDLGMSPLCQRHIGRDELNRPEQYYPLHVFVCGSCMLVQLGEYVSPSELFDDYAYFSSFSETWLNHAEQYTHRMTERCRFNEDSFVVEIASNDGYLLQYFVELGVSVLGVEPAANVARAAIDKGVRTLVEFFGRRTAERICGDYGPADLIIGNNVLAHVPDLNDFVAGIKQLLAPGGTLTMEFPHLMQLFEQNQFDTIYHEHFSYFSFTTANRVFAAHGITLFDVEELPTHGGSLRIFGRHDTDVTRTVADNVTDLLSREQEWGVDTMLPYVAFAEKVGRTKRELLSFLIDAKRDGKRIVGYGAPGKGNTLLNYCGIGRDFLDYTVDLNPHKQGMFTPGTHIPILHPDHIRETKPDYLLILPWNITAEIMKQMDHISAWGGQFVVPIPEVAVYG